MLEQDGIVDRLAGDAVMAEARTNYVNNVGVNPDQEAVMQQKARALGITNEAARATPDDLDRMLAAQYADRIDLPPVARKYLANIDFARLVASTPQAYEDLSLPEKIMNRFASGWAMGGVKNAARDIETAAKDIQDPLRYLTAESEKEEEVIEMLREWAKRPDSPFMQDAQERYREATRDLAIANYEAQQIAEPKVLSEIAESESVGEAVALALQNPMAAIIGTGIQSAVAMRENLLVTAAAYAANPVLGAMSMGASSYDLEYGSTINEVMAESGVDMTDPIAIRKALQDPTLLQKAVQKAQDRAAVVGTFDAAAGLVAPIRLKPMTNVVAMSRAAKRVLAGGEPIRQVAKAGLKMEVSPAMRELDNLFGQGLVGALSGAAGEATAQIVTEGGVTSWGEVVLEAMGEFATAPIDVLMARSSIKKLQQQAVQAEAAKQIGAGLVEVLDAASKSEVAMRDPQAYKQYLVDAAKGKAMEHLYASVEQLKATGVFDTLVQTAPQLREQLALAEATGGDIELSVGDLFEINRVSPETANTLVSLVRSGEDGMSMAEAQQFDADSGALLSKAAEDLVKAEGKRIVDAANMKTELDVALSSIENGIRKAYPDRYEADGLIAANRAIVESISRRTGVSPSKLVSLLGPKLRVDPTSRLMSGKMLGDVTLGYFTPKKNTITINKEGTASTFMHEMAHFWIETFTQGIATGKLKLTDPTYAESWSKMYDWLGAKGETLEEKASDFATSPNYRAMHEKFAEGFEAYMRDGKPPVEGLEAVFESFKEFMRRLVSAYPSASRDQLPDDVIALYDDIFFSDAQAAGAMESAGGISVDMDNYMKTHLTKEEYEAYKGAFTLSGSEAATKIEASHKRNQKLVNNARERAKRGLDKAYKDILARAKKTVLARREFQTLDVLKSGPSIRQDKIKIKMSRDAAKLQLTKDAYNYASKRGWLREKGPDTMSPKDLSELLGYPSAQDMVEEAWIANETDVDAEAKKIADKEFLDLYGEAATEKGRQRLAGNAVYNRSRLLVLATEFRALKGLIGNVRDLMRTTTAFAKAAIGKKNVFEVRSKGFEAAAQRARRERDKALSKGEIDRAAEFTRAELMNAALARQAGDVVQARTRFLRRIKQMIDSQSIDFGYRDQIRNLTAKANIMSFKQAKGNPKAPSIVDFLNSDPSDPYLAQLRSEAPQFILDGTTPDVHDMTVEEFMQYANFMTRLATLGRKVGANQRADRKNSEVQARMRVNEAIEKHAQSRDREIRNITTETRPWLQRKEKIVGFFQDHIKISTWCRIFDGNKFGVCFDEIIKPANKCADAERLWLSEVNTKLEKLIDPLIKKGMHTNDVVIDGVKYSLGERLVIALNMGNEVNRERLKKGNGLSEETQAKIISTLTQDELATVQQIWDIFDSFKPKIEAMNRRLYGETLDWTTPTPLTVTASDGAQVTLRGGYYPIKYDTASAKGQASAQITRMEQEAEIALAGGFTGTTTARTYSKARAKEGLDVPLRKDIEPLFDAVAEVIHDVSWREFLLRAGRLGTSVKVVNEDGSVTVVDGITTTMAKYYGANVAKQYKDWLSNIARAGAGPRNVADRYATLIRRGVSLAGLGFNVVSAMIQITGLIPAMTRIGVKGTTAAVLNYTSNMKLHASDIAARSDFMKVRTDTFLRELDDLRGRVRGGTTRTGRAIIKTQEAAYFMMAFVQSHIDRIVWLGAYEQAVSQGLSEAECVARADQTVRDTQGSGLISDQASIEIGTVAKLLTAFYSFMNTAYNLNAAALLGENNKAKAAADLITVSLMLPIIEGFLRATIQPGDDDDDKEWTDYVAEATGNVVSFNMGLLVGVREMSNAVGNFVAGEPVYTWRGPSSFRVFSDATQFLSQADQGEFDIAMTKAIFNLAGSVTGFPAAQTNKFIDGFDALVNEQKTDNPLVLITGYKEK